MEWFWRQKLGIIFEIDRHCLARLSALHYPYNCNKHSTGNQWNGVLAVEVYAQNRHYVLDKITYTVVFLFI